MMFKLKNEGGSDSLEEEESFESDDEVESPNSGLDESWSSKEAR